MAGDWSRFATAPEMLQVIRTGSVRLIVLSSQFSVLSSQFSVLSVGGEFDAPSTYCLCAARRFRGPRGLPTSRCARRRAAPGSRGMGLARSMDGRRAGDPLCRLDLREYRGGDG